VDDAERRPLIAQFIANLPKYDGSEHILSEHQKGGTYKPQLVEEADLIIVAVANEVSNYVDIAKGCYSEIQSAFAAGIPVVVIGTFGNTKPFMQTIKKGDLRIQNEDVWQVGYAQINIYNTTGGLNVGDKAGEIDSEAKVDTFVTSFMTDLLNKKAVIRPDSGNSDAGKWEACEDQSNVALGWTKVQQMSMVGGFLRLRHKLVEDPTYPGERVKAQPSYVVKQTIGRVDRGDEELLLL